LPGAKPVTTGSFPILFAIIATLGADSTFNGIARSMPQVGNEAELRGRLFFSLILLCYLQASR
jgi:hypothetical protein